MEPVRNPHPKGEYATILIPRGKKKNDYMGNIGEEWKNVESFNARKKESCY